MPITPSGNKYYVALIDIFSKYLWVKAIPLKNAENVHDFYCSIITENGPFLKLQSDNGKEFKNSKVRDLLTEKKIGKQFYLSKFF